MVPTLTRSVGGFEGERVLVQLKYSKSWAMDVAMRMADTRIYRSMYICLERKRSGRYMHLRIHVNMWHAMAVYGYMTITCNAAISACRIGREWPRALDVLAVMARSSIQIDTITCNAAVSSSEVDGERARALDILGNMEPWHGPRNDTWHGRRRGI